MSLLGAYFTVAEIRTMDKDVRMKIESGIRYGVLVQPRAKNLAGAGVRVTPKAIFSEFEALKKELKKG